MSNLIVSTTMQNIKRSGWNAVFLILVMVVTYTILGLSLLMMYTSKGFSDYFAQLPEVVGFFSDDASEEDILKVKNDLESKDYVIEVTYVSKEQAMKDFLETNKDNKDVIEAVTTNVFPAHLNVKTKNLDYIDDVKSYLENNDLIIEVQAFEGSLNTLKKIVIGIQIVGFTLTAIFSLSTALIIFLTIGLSVYSRKDEIIVMKLVGATNWFVRAPYLLQSALFALIAVAISSMILIFPIYYYYDDVIYAISGNFNALTINIETLSYGFVIELIFCLLLALFGSFLATRKYIKY